MKRMIIAIVFIIVGVGVAVGGYFNLKHICNDMCDTLENVISSVDEQNSESVISSCIDAKSVWDKKKSLLGVYTNHSEMDELQIFMKDLQRLAEDENYEQLTDDCYECIYHFEHIRESELPSFGNLF